MKRAQIGRLRKVKLYLAVLLANFVPYSLIGKFVSGELVDFGFNLIRIATFGYAGLVLSRVEGVSIRDLFLIAIVLSTFDHVLLKGGLFFFDALLKEEETLDEAAIAFAGVVTSYVLYAPVAFLVVYLGSLVGRQVKAKGHGG